MNPSDVPKANRDPRELRRKESLLEAPHMAALTAFVRRMRREVGRDVPWFDPTEAGVEARLLFLLSSPGPQAATLNGSGFVSADNDDRTAGRVWELLRDLGVDRREEVVAWNIVPWVPAGLSVRVRDLDAAEPWLRELLSMLPRVRAVVLFGRTAQAGWKRFDLGGGLEVFEASSPTRCSRAELQRISETIQSARVAAGVA